MNSNDKFNQDPERFSKAAGKFYEEDLKRFVTMDEAEKRIGQHFSRITGQKIPFVKCEKHCPPENICDCERKVAQETQRAVNILKGFDPHDLTGCPKIPHPPEYTGAQLQELIRTDASINEVRQDSRDPGTAYLITAGGQSKKVKIIPGHTGSRPGYEDQVDERTTALNIDRALAVLSVNRYNITSAQRDRLKSLL